MKAKKESTKSTVTKTAAAAAEKVTEKVTEAVSDVVEKAPGATAKLVEKTKKDVEKAVTTAKKTTARKSPAKEKEAVYLQCYGEEVSIADVKERIKAVWTGELGQKVSALKSLTVYLKPEEGKAYYVINDDVTGSVDL